MSKTGLRAKCSRCGWLWQLHGACSKDCIAPDAHDTEHDTAHEETRKIETKDGLGPDSDMQWDDGGEKYDYINPPHYKSGTKETYQMMIDCFGVEAFMNFCELSIFKYRQRLGSKPGEDPTRELEKIRWYQEKLDHYKSRK